MFFSESSLLSTFLWHLNVDLCSLYDILSSWLCTVKMAFSESRVITFALSTTLGPTPYNYKVCVYEMGCYHSHLLIYMDCCSYMVFIVMCTIMLCFLIFIFRLCLFFIA